MGCVLRVRRGQCDAGPAWLRRLGGGDWWQDGALYGLAAVAAAFADGPARADEAPTGIPEPSIATSLPAELADPGGVRAALASRGVTFGINYIGEVLGTASGGFKQGTFYDGRLEVAVAADMEKMIGWRGLTFFANGYQIHGQGITAESLGALMPVSFIEATPATRLFEIWFEQRLLRRQAVDPLRPDRSRFRVHSHR